MPCFDEIYIPMPNEKSSPSWFGFPIIINTNASFSRYDLVTYLNQNKLEPDCFLLAMSLNNHTCNQKTLEFLKI